MSNVLHKLTNLSSLLRFRGWVAVLCICGVVVLIMFVIPEQQFSREYFQKVGYSGLFLVTLIANASIILPTPGFLAVIAAGAVLNPLLVAIIGAAGMTIGELSGYLVGRAGASISNRKGSWQQRWPSWAKLSQRLVGRWGAFGIVILAATPNPLFDLAGITAGAIKMGIIQFFAATFVGRLIRTSLLAYASFYSVGGILDFFG